VLASAGALLAGALEIGPAAGAGVDDEAAALDDAACELEPLLHPTNASEADSVMTTQDQILERDNRDIRQE
jgi:hypothetical protein